MKLADLDFTYPEDLVATEPKYPSRVMWVEPAVGGVPVEKTLQEVLEQIPAGDLLVVNNTKVLKRRVFAGDLEILFLSQVSEFEWDVLFPSKKYKVGAVISLPDNVEMTLVEKGRPQRVRVSRLLEENYFSQFGELPLPPYIQKARNLRHTIGADETWYQTAWAEKPGSFAAPTASLHFKESDIEFLRSRGVVILEITLHVGLGTFLPVTAEDLDHHDMHEEYAEVPLEVWTRIQTARKSGHKVWSLGTTTTRALESVGAGLLPADLSGNFKGFTKILIQPPYVFKVVDRLLTNFHQPESTLLALVSAFASLDQVKACYGWAMERKFRLFSYGDLSIWLK